MVTDFGTKFNPEQEYERLMGEDALERQKQAAKERYSCCFQLKTVGHLPLCPLHKLRKKP